ncbi:WD40/YVTN/BNR-like repeat-containing protein [Salinigranum sp.]|uniref:WD40/YVTN/BNR-like repeat-containing protein n=1 Tax=Salinigranum sp. TaxID=1966351 RepID=UPI0035653750
MDRLYAALPDRVAAVDVDADGAEVRRETTPTPDASVQCVAASPVDADAVCCGTADDGLFRSTDAGATWESVTGIDHVRLTSVTCAPADADVPADVTWWAGTEPSRVYRSSDGVTWRACDGLTDLPSSSSWAFPPRPHTHHVRWVEVDPHDPGHLYVAVEAGALVQTHDGGETWEDRVEGSRRDTHSMATHAGAPGRAYCAAGDGYAETTDGGETWHHPQEGLSHRYCWSVVVDSADPEHRLLSAASGAMRAHRAGSAETYVYRKHGEAPWERVDGLPTGDGVTRYVLAAGRERFYALSNAGLFRSPDGESWDRLPLSVADDVTAAGLVTRSL